MTRMVRTGPIPFGFWLVLGCIAVFFATMAVIGALVASGVVRD